MTRAGLCTDILTGGSTGSWDIDSNIPEVTELQAGSSINGPRLSTPRRRFPERPNSPDHSH